MNRLTEKVKNTDDYIKLPTKDKQEFIDKLGELEDLEERLSCDLVEAGAALYIIITKELNIEDFRICVEKNENDYEALAEFNSKQWTSNEITLEEYLLIKNVYYEIIEKFYKIKEGK